MNLLDYKKDIYSQKGEDGVIEKALEIIPDKKFWCVEFGAYDGIFYSNTRNLIENHGYSAYLIEADRKKFQELTRNYDSFDSVICKQAYVGFSEEDNLDHLLKETGVPDDFDFLSIDIDGNDYHVWQSITKYVPKMVCVEFNPTIPVGLDFVQSPDPAVIQGAGLSSMVELGKSKGYELVAALRFNAFFVKEEYFPLFKIKDNSPEILWKDDRVTYSFSDMRGHVHLEGCKKLPWHRLNLSEEDFQVLPGFLQDFPPEYNFLQKFVFASFLLIREPAELKHFLKDKLNFIVSKFGRDS